MILIKIIFNSAIQVIFIYTECLIDNLIKKFRSNNYIFACMEFISLRIIEIGDGVIHKFIGNIVYSLEDIFHCFAIEFTVLTCTLNERIVIKTLKVIVYVKFSSIFLNEGYINDVFIRKQSENLNDFFKSEIFP